MEAEETKGIRVQCKWLSDLLGGHWKSLGSGCWDKGEYGEGDMEYGDTTNSYLMGHDPEQTPLLSFLHEKALQDEDWLFQRK